MEIKFNIVFSTSSIHTHPSFIQAFLLISLVRKAFTTSAYL